MYPTNITNFFLGQRSFKKIITVLAVFLLGANGVMGQSPQTFTASGTWTCPAGVTSVQVQCWGGGGAGGSAIGTSTSSRRAAAGGGAGGAYVISTINVIPGTVYTVTVGTGGIAVNTNGVATSGGDSWFSTNTTIIAKGGAGANSLVCTTSSDLTSSGGVGTTTGSIGTTVYKGGDGASGTTPSGAGFSGGGGSSAGTGSNGTSATNSVAAAAVTGGGIGGTGRSSNGGNGSAPASGFGGGGGGAWAASSPTQRTGGSGANGRIILTWSVTATPSIAISNETIAAGSPNNGQTNVILQRYDMAVTTANATLTGLTVTTAGTYVAADLSNLKCWYQTSTTFNSGTATLLSTKSTSLGSGSQVFPSFTSQSITSGNTGYIFVTADIASGATNGNTINIASNAFSNISFSSGTKTGTDPVAAGGVQTITVAVPDIALSSPAASSANITVGSSNNVIYRFDLAITTATPSLTGVTLNTSTGSNISGDLTNLKCWYQTTSTFNAGTATLLSTKTTSLAAGSQVFPTFSSQSLTTGSTYYIFITADVPLTATPNNTIIVSAITTSDLTFATGNKTGTANASGTKTIIDCTPTDVTSAAASSASSSSVLTWVNPACYDEILIVAALASNTGTPTGNGSAYTGNLAYGSGTALGNGFVVYKGSTSSQTVTGLTNGTQYFYKFFTRRGTTWTSGTEVDATPNVAGYYWNGASIAANPAAGGTGTWGTANSWRQPSSSGAQATWANSNNAVFAGTAGSVTIDADRSATAYYFNTSGYVLANSTTQTLTGPIVLGNNVGLTFSPNVNIVTPAGGTVNIGSVSGSGNANITINSAQGSATNVAQRINLATASSSISVPINIVSAGGTGTGTVAGIVATATGTSLSSTASITNNTAVKTVIGATSGNDITANGVISGSADLMFAGGASGGAGTITLGAANTYTGATIFNAANSGVIRLGITNALPTGTNVTMANSTSNGGIFDLNGFNQTIGSLTSGVGGGSIRNNGATDATLTISGSTSPAAFGLVIADGTTNKTLLTRAGTGTLTLSGANTYTGATTVNAGTLSISSIANGGSNSGIGASSNAAANLVLGGGTLQYTGVIASTDRNFTLTDATTSTINTTNQLTISGASTTTTGALTKAGAGTLILGGSNLYTGATSINNGTIQLTTGNDRLPTGTVLSLGQASSTNLGTFNLNGLNQTIGGLNSTSGTNATASNNTITSSSAATLTVSGSGTYGDGTNANSGIIAGAISLVKSGTGTLTLGDVNTYTGTTTINGGTLTLSGSGSIASPTITVGSSGTFDVTGLTSALTLAASQTMRGSSTGSNTTGTIKVASSKNLTLSAGGLTFTALAATTTPPLTVDGAGGNLVLVSGCGITVPNNLTVGTYKLIAKSGLGATVSGTTGTLSYTGSGNNTSASVALTDGELVLTVRSSLSNIVLNAGFTHPTNIDYTSYQAASTLTTSNSIEVGQFDIQDGGGSNDADALSTSLTAISFTVANFANIRTLALFDGNTNVAEITSVTATSSFSGLTLAASDDGSKTFSVRATFKSAVTDNQQFSFTVSSATASGSGSSFAAANAGAAATTTTGDNNRIIVSTTGLIFHQNVSVVAQNAVMNPSPTVKAVDANSNYDLDNTSNVTLTITTGSTTFDGSATTTVAMVAGVATFSNLIFVTAATANNLTATQGSFTVISSAFNVTLAAPEINVKQHVTSLASGSGSHAAASVVSGTSGSGITFTIENLGSANLTYSSITNSNTTDFTLDATNTITPIAASGTTTFTVAFNPTTAGAKSTTITIYNNDVDEGTYTFTVTGTGTVSSASDIISNSAYSYSSNIDYASFQTASTLTTGNSIGVNGLTLRDGGATTDADNLATTLTAITFSTGGSTAIRTAALFDGSTNVAEVAVNGGTSIAFSGLTLTTTTDGGTKDFELRVTYQASVTDNQQITFTVSSATASATISGFAAANAGAAASTATSDINRLEVTADRLAFVVQPIEVNINVAMTPSVTVSANDANNNRDLDYVSNMTATTTGTFAAASTNTVVPTAGLGTFSNLQFSASGTGITIAIGSGSLTASGNSSAFDVSNFSVGDFRSNVTTGNWSSASSWQTWNGLWVTATAAPTSSTSATKNITILNSHTITADHTSNQYCKDLIINAGGKLYGNSGAAKFVNVYGNITCNGTIGNGSTYDGIAFDTEGSSCTISGSGTFDAARIAKNSITSPAATTTTLTFDMNVNLRYGGTGSGNQSLNNTELYVNIAGATLNVVINQNKTLACIGDGTLTAGAAISIDGVDGAGSSERGGSLTVNGTLDIQQTGTGVSTLFLKTNNTTSAVSVSIGATGTINTPKIDCAASGAAGHTFSIASGGTLNITGEPTSFVPPSNTNNTYTFNANSNINYNKLGAQTIYTFGSSVYQGNITLSGSGVKSMPSALNVSTSVNSITINSGATFTLSSTSGGDLKVAENLSGTGTFNGNSRAVYFNGTGSQTLTRADNFPYLIIDKASGTLTIAAAISLTNKLTYTKGAIAISAGGSIDVSGSSAEVEFSNSSSFTLPVGLFNGTINKLTMNCGSGILLSENVAVSGTLNMVQGNVTTAVSPNGLLTLGTSSTVPGTLTWTSGNIVGPFRRYFASSATSGNAGLFPVGTAAYQRYAKVDFTASPGTDQTLTAWYKTGAAMSGAAAMYNGLPLSIAGATVQNYSADGYWQIDPTGGDYSASIASAPYDITLYANALAGMTTPSICRIIKSPGSNTPGSNHVVWQATGGTHTAIAAGTPAGAFAITNTGVTGFSWFNVGSPNGQALPVELMSFSGNCADGQVNLEWQTASEHNSLYFEVEKSRDGENWQVLSTVPSAGNSTELLTYQAVDAHAGEDNNYYRLNQVDIDGANKVYDLINVSCSAGSKGYFSTYPNPTTGAFQVVLNDKEMLGAATLSIRDTKGASLLQRAIEVKPGVNLFSVNDLNLAPGLYYIQVINGDQTTEVLKEVIR